MSYTLYPRLGVTCTVSGTTVPVTGVTVDSLSDEVVNLLRKGKLVQVDAYASDAEQKCNAIDAGLGADSSAIPRMVQVNGNVTPAAAAAASQAISGEVVFFFAPPQDFGHYAPDVATMSAQPGYNAATWYTCSFTNVVAREKAYWTAWIQDYIAAGGRTPTHVAADQEDAPSWYTIQPRGGEDNAAGIYNTVPFFQQHFGYSTFAAWKASLGFVPGLYFYLSWSNAAIMCFDAALDEAYTEVFQSFWPDVEVSFYGEQHISKADVTVPYLTGFADWWDTHAGTHTAPEMYGWTNNGATWGARTFDVVLWEIARLRNQRKSHPGTPICPWIAYADYVPPSATPTGYEHTREKVYHCYLAGCSRVLYFNPAPPFGGTAKADTYMNETAAEVQELFSNHQVTPLTNNIALTATSHNSEWFMSGAQVGGEYLWRVTISEKVKAVRVDGVCQPREAGVYGVWIKTATSTAPNVTVDLENGPL